jgi:N1-acetylpolyamine oxidase
MILNFFSGPDYEFPGGFSKLIEHSSRNIPKSCIKLNHPVERIRLLERSTAVLSADDSTKNVLLVECQNGSLFRAKHVVVTCSVNYLQKHYASLFDSALLTQRKIDAIQTVQMSTVDKIFLFYDDLASFFPPGAVAVKPVFSEEEDPNALMKDKWVQKVYTFDKFYDNVLLVWLTGEEANYAETLSEEEIVDSLTGLLKKLLRNENVSKPNRMLMTDWNSNPYMLGSYSYIDLKGTVEHIHDLAEPLYIDKVVSFLEKTEFKPLQND